jgi:predicted DNA-binding transcriptional regulator YafY
LKEYRNRWFALGSSHRNNKPILHLALDRIQNIAEGPDLYLENDRINLATYYNDVIGVTKAPGQRDVEVIFWMENKAAPYIITKPLHATQKILREDADGKIFSIKVIHNYELERELLGFGPQLRVIRPQSLQKQMKLLLKTALSNYDTKGRQDQ